ncbi:MAG: arginine--tRNA ligase [Phycisphaerae bacterium]|nr:arginine--tRNA ligase [Phycisphaerae bacterium]
MNIKTTLERRISDALAAAGAAEAPAMVKPASRPEFGDYQADGCLAAAKKMKTNPRKFAEAVVEKLDLSDLAEKVELAGAGFINITLKRDWLDSRLAAMFADEKHLCVPIPKNPETVIVDYSGPNLAKEMHVGHLRSTIIGDALARTLQFIGYNVIPQNHVGDWGTQFGMLVEFILYVRKEKGGIVGERDTDGVVVTVDSDLRINDLEFLYRMAKRKYDTDPEFAEKARKRVVLLQSGDKETLEIWEKFRKESLRHCKKVYEALGVLLSDKDVRGESFYNDDLPNVVADLEKRSLLKISDGAKGVYLEEFKNQDDKPFFMIVQKSDGGYLYATTDLAAIRYRVQELHADRILYVTDSRQAQHFAQVFAVAKKADFVNRARHNQSTPWLRLIIGKLINILSFLLVLFHIKRKTNIREHKLSTKLEHVPFGMMLGTDGRPFKTREGGTVKLMDLIDQAEYAAGIAMDQREDVYPQARSYKTYKAIGVGALKYADLSQNRTSDYVFSWDKMLSLDGNTAPYMQYAYARIQSIFRKQDEMSPACQGGDSAMNGTIHVVEPAERALGVKLLQFPETIEAVAETCLPNILCAYLYDLAGAFMGFYETCPVLKSEGDIRAGRVALCKLAARVIQKGLELLGIDVLEQM